MIRLTYVSTCKTGLVLADVRAILAVATKANVANGISGMLYWSGEYFMQTLEGERAPVTTCFNRVCRDVRHTDVELVNAVPTGTRWFGEWSMGFTQLLAPHRVQLASGAHGFNPYLLDANELMETLTVLSRNAQRLSP